MLSVIFQRNNFCNNDYYHCYIPGLCWRGKNCSDEGLPDSLGIAQACTRRGRGGSAEERQSESREQTSRRLQISDASLRQGLPPPPPPRLPLHHCCPSSHVQQSSRSASRAVRAHSVPTHTHTHKHKGTLCHTQRPHAYCFLLMVVGRLSSAAAPTPVFDHEEAQAADGAAELPQLLQQKTQTIRAEARGRQAQGGSGHHAHAERTPWPGESDRPTLMCCLETERKMFIWKCSVL